MHAAPRWEALLNRIILTVYRLVRTEKLRPAFLQYHHPNLVSSCWFSGHKVALFFWDWKVVVNYDFHEDSPEEHSSHVDAIFVDL